MPPGVKKKHRRSAESRNRNGRTTYSRDEAAVRFISDSSSSEASDIEIKMPRKYTALRKKSAGCSRTERQLTVIIVICIFIILIMTTLFLVRFIVNVPKAECKSPTCVVIAGEVLKNMDLTVDPCEDFYTYSCGQWIQNTVMPPEEPKWGSFNVLAQKNEGVLKRLLEEPGAEYLDQTSMSVLKAKQYYQACLNMSATDERGITPLLQMIEEIGSWTLTSGNQFDPDNWQLLQKLITDNQYGVGTLFSMSVSADDKNSTNNIICFDQSGLSFDDRKFYLGNSSETYHKALVQYIKRVATLLGPSTNLHNKVEQIWQFEKSLAKIMASQEERQDQRKLYHKMKVSQVQDIVGDWIDLSEYLAALFGEKVSDNEEVLVYAVDYLKRLGDIVKNTDKEVLANYLVWQRVAGFVPYMPLQFREAQLELKDAIYGINAMKPLWELCVGRTAQMFPYPTGGMFVQGRFFENERKSAEELIGYIQKQFEANLPKVNWMDEETRKRAKDKVKAVTNKIGYPEVVKNIAKMDEKYKDFEIDPYNAFLNVKNALKFYANDNFKQRGKPVDKNRWGMSAQEVNAYYEPTNNEMAFPAGILQEPFYDTRYPMAMKFGGIGMVMGHELSHGFDNQGRLFDKQGNMANWWTNQSARAFDQRSKCLVDQYNSYTVGSSHINGITTLGENIADNGGLKTAYDAYQTWLGKHGHSEPEARLAGLNMTENQLFFMGFARAWCSYATPEYAQQALVTDPHTSAKYRVIGSVSNMKEFSEAFQCREGSAMNPANKCHLW